MEQANKKVEVTMNRLKLEEIELLNGEFGKVDYGERDVIGIEEMLMKLKYFKNLNPQLRRLVIQRAHYKTIPRDAVIYS